jgi:hypothetical protein
MSNEAQKIMQKTIEQKAKEGVGRIDACIRDILKDHAPVAFWFINKFKNRFVIKHILRLEVIQSSELIEKARDPHKKSFEYDISYGTGGRNRDKGRFFAESYKAAEKIVYEHIKAVQMQNVRAIDIHFLPHVEYDRQYFIEVKMWGRTLGKQVIEFQRL